MRMFLVGMCDIFLLLYLTALAQVDARQISDLTVKDYVALKRSSEETERAKAGVQEKLTAAEVRAAAMEEALKRLQRAESELTQQRASDAKSREAALKQLAQAEKRSAEIEKVSAEQARKAEQAAAESQRLLAEVTDANKAKEDARLKAEQLKQEAEEAKRQAEQARKEAEEKAQEALAAQKAREEAIHDAELARRGEQEARAAQTVANRDASAARVAASEALHTAEAAKDEAQQQQERVQAIKKPVAQAFQENIFPKITELQIEIVSKGFFGNQRRNFGLRTFPVQIGQEIAVFIPRAELFSDPKDARDVLEFKAMTGSRPVTALYFNPSRPDIVGVAFAGNVIAASPLGKQPLSSYMPTLIAIRSGAGMELRNSIRGLSADSYPFQRDRLSETPAGTFLFTARGFRGTGEFGEQILQGDQIVDLDGNYVGVAIREKEIEPITGFDGWTKVPLSAGTNPFPQW